MDAPIQGTAPMHQTVVKIQCSNPQCLHSNSQNQKFCPSCRTPIVKRYLWAVGAAIDRDRKEKLIGDRYLPVAPNLLLDTKPGLSPELTEDIPSLIIPYLKLLPQRLHVPQVYGFCSVADRQPIWLLEYLSLTNFAGAEFQPFPALTEAWQTATGKRQLNWLWQIASLWSPLETEGVVSTLLQPELLEISGSIVRVKHLQIDNAPVNLQQLGQLWSEWSKKSAANVKKFLGELSLALEQGKISTARQLGAILEQAVRKCGQSQQYQYQVLAASESGPTRKNNEDACYPVSGTLVQTQDQDNSLAIVCDGLGGHEGGEVASQMAVDFLQESLQHLSRQERSWCSEKISLELENLTCAANDLIRKRNEQENRYEPKQRMGTTLVMGLTHEQEIYLTHIGDSRIYWITNHGCYQVSVDDDLASKETRLGNVLYREALQYPSGGALVQALGMNASGALHPTVQRLLLDEDSVILLCSDGLSDGERVEQYWQSEIPPLIQGKRKIQEVVQRLLAIANQKNGHDNVTVALISCHLEPKQHYAPISLSAADFHLFNQQFSNQNGSGIDTQTPPTTESKTQKTPTSPTLSGNRWGLVSLLLLATVGIGYWVLSSSSLLRLPQRPFSEPTPVTAPQKTSFDNGEVIQVKEAIKLEPIMTSESVEGEVKVTAGSVLSVVKKVSVVQHGDHLTSWLLLKVCQYPYLQQNNNKSSGDGGWIELKALQPAVSSNFVPSAETMDACEL